MNESIAAIEALINDAKKYLNIDPPLAEEKAREAESLSRSCGCNEGLYESLFLLSRLHSGFNRITSAIEFCEECLSIAKKLKDNKRIALAQNALGICYNLMGVHSKSLEHFMETLELVRKHDLSDVEARIHNNIASVFSDLKDFGNALNYLLKAYEKAVLVNEPVSLYLRNIANCYVDLKDYEKAYEYCIRARNANWREKDEEVAADIYFILSVILSKRGRPVRARKVSDLAFRLAEKYHSLYEMAEGFISRSRLHIEDKEFGRAMECLDEAVKISEKYGYLDLFQQIYKLFAEVLGKIGDKEKEIEVLRKYMAITDRMAESEHEKKRSYAAMQLALFNMRKEHQSLKNRADTDCLTGCLVYRDFEEKITKALDQNDRQGAMLFMDVDNLKLVNDRYGHHAGDKLIIEFANTLNLVFKDRGLIFRKGGDEFIAFLPKAGRHDVIRLLEELYAHLSKARIIGKSVMSISCSIGVAMAPQDSGNARELEWMSDKAMYKAKNMGKRCYRFYDSLCTPGIS